MKLPGYLSHKEIEDQLPSEIYSHQLNDCPECGAEYCIPVQRMGPTLLMFTSRDYVARCLNCGHRAKHGLTPEQAIELWNEEIKPTRLKELRLAAGLSQQKLCDLAGVKSNSTLCHWETGHRVMSEELKGKFAKALGVSVDEL